VLVCHCFAVNDRRIREAIAAGARCETDIARACGAGTDCGGCLPTVNRLLDECTGCALAPATVDLTQRMPVAVS
jgi:bacterioferritin-associated ferredoxin